MKTMMLLAGAALAPALTLAAPATAQVANIAVADPAAVVLTANALSAANTQIGTTYKAQLDQVRAREAALQSQLQTIAKPLDTNKDGQISDAEIQAAQNAKSPVLQQLETARTTGQQEINRINEPMIRAQLYAIEQIAQKYNTAMQTVINAKRIGLLIGPGTVQFAGPTADVTNDIKAELDRVTPSVSISPPANWQPAQQTIQLFQQYQQLAQLQAARAAQGQAPAAAPAAGRPATTGRPATKPSGR